NRLVRVTTDVFELLIDRQGGDIVELSLLNYPRHVDTPDQPFQLLLNTPQQFQIMQSGLIGKNGTDTQDGRPLWLADSTEYSLDDNARELNVDLRYFQSDNVVITKRFTFVRDSYLIRLSHVVENKGRTPWQGASYGQVERDNSEPPRPCTRRFVTVPAFLGGAWWSADTPSTKESRSHLEDEPLKTTQEGGWIAM